MKFQLNHRTTQFFIFLSFLLLLRENTMADSSASNTPNANQRWFPLESNPQLINDYIQKLGFDTSLYEFCDVFSTEDWALDMIPQPVAAVLMLYPLTEKQEKSTGDDVVASEEDQKDIWFMKQRIGNACGTIGLLHTLMNAPEPIRMFAPGSWLDNFKKDTDGAEEDPVKKAEILEGDSKIAKLHDDATSSESNQTSRGALDDAIITHFIALVCINDKLYELDGRKKGPIYHGPTTQGALLKDACKVIQKFMARDPEEVRFTITALAPKQG